MSFEKQHFWFLSHYKVTTGVSSYMYLRIFFSFLFVIYPFYLRVAFENVILCLKKDTLPWWSILRGRLAFDVGVKWARGAEYHVAPRIPVETRDHSS